MIKRNRFLCTVTAVTSAACCAVLMTSCGDDGSSSSPNPGEAVSITAETDASDLTAQEQTTTLTSTSEATTTTYTETTAASIITGGITGRQQGNAGRTDESYNGAYTAVESFLNACVAKDSEELLDLTHLGAYYDTAVELGLSNDQPALDEILGDLMQIDRFTIGQAVENLEYPEEFNFRMETILSDYAAATADNKNVKADQKVLYAKTMAKITKLYQFSVEYGFGAEFGSTQLYAAFAGGKWYIDPVIIPAMLTEDSGYSVSAANAVAKAVMVAVNNSLSALDGAGFDISTISGDYYYSGDDFVNANVVTSIQFRADAIRWLNYSIKTLYGDVQGCEQVAFRIDRGTCSAAAVQYGKDYDPEIQGDQYYFGCYPNQLADEDFGTYFSIEDVLAHAVVK